MTVIKIMLSPQLLQQLGEDIVIQIDESNLQTTDERQVSLFCYMTATIRHLKESGHVRTSETTTIPYSDLYMGLKTGVADGQENPWVNVEGMKFYEVQKYFTEVNYQFHPDPFYVNAAWWNGLPEEYRDIITECATKMGEYNDELIDKNSSAAKQTIVDSGCEVYEPSADELKAFQTAVQSVYDQCVTEGICTADEIKEMQDIVANPHREKRRTVFLQETTCT